VSGGSYLVVGLGNIGAEYAGTRHNIGFRVVNELAEGCGASFVSERYGGVSRLRLKNVRVTLLKPNTMMNLSGDAVRYWLQKEKLGLGQVLVVVDDIALPFGSLRVRVQGSHAGHNGLKHIQAQLGSTEYARLRVGIGNGYPRGGQVSYVLGQFTAEEQVALPGLVERSVEAVRTYCLSGAQEAMNRYN
jgi:PTH1 family peptidyl-tRNA hydrolase